MRELVYARDPRLRRRSRRAGARRCCGWREDDPALAALFDGSPLRPAADRAEGELVAEGGVAPAWLVERAGRLRTSPAPRPRRCSSRAPLDIRVNTLKADRATLDAAGRRRADRRAAGPAACRPARRSSSGTPTATGLIEVQDTGSQLACEAVGARPGETVIDLCAGAGGKTLALAAAMDNRGTLIAADTDRGRLSRLAAARRRGPARGSIETRAARSRPRGRGAGRLARARADAVLVDAPCSGTGTWRRNPEARWRLTPAALERASPRCRRACSTSPRRWCGPGGRLVYVVCSLLDAEGAGPGRRASSPRHPGWRAEPLDAAARARRAGTDVRLTPFHDGTDGFFIARLATPC